MTKMLSSVKIHDLALKSTKVDQLEMFDDLRSFAGLESVLLCSLSTRRSGTLTTTTTFGGMSTMECPQSTSAIFGFLK